MQDDDDRDTGTGDVSSTIRSLIERDAATPRAPAAAPARPKPAVEAKAVPDRWADLRAKFAELDDEADDDETEATLPVEAEEAPESPIEAVRRRAAEAEARAAAAPPPVEEAPAIAHPFEEAALAEPEPDPEGTPAQQSQREWDSPSDHVMGKRARMAWRIGIYGTLAAVPVAFFLTSPFSPKDTVQHHVSALGCQFAALFDWENIEDGQPGYHAKFDEDGDGIACEVKKTRMSMGGSGFKRP